MPSFSFLFFSFFNVFLFLFGLAFRRDAISTRTSQAPQLRDSVITKVTALLQVRH